LIVLKTFKAETFFTVQKHTKLSQNAHLGKYSHKPSQWCLKRTQTVEKENACV